MNNTTGNDRNMPIGLAMTLAQDVNAMHRFAMMSDSEQRQLLDSARSVKSKAEMKQIVNSITYNEFT